MRKVIIIILSIIPLTVISLGVYYRLNNSSKDMGDNNNNDVDKILIEQGYKKKKKDTGIEKNELLSSALNSIKEIDKLGLDGEYLKDNKRIFTTKTIFIGSKWYSKSEDNSGNIVSEMKGEGESIYVREEEEWFKIPDNFREELMTLKEEYSTLLDFSLLDQYKGMGVWELRGDKYIVLDLNDQMLVMFLEKDKRLKKIYALDDKKEVYAISEFNYGIEDEDIQMPAEYKEMNVEEARVYIRKLRNMSSNGDTTK